MRRHRYLPKSEHQLFGWYRHFVDFKAFTVCEDILLDRELTAS
jgi:hypothetical protein